MYRGEASELARYRADLADPRNDEIRGFEIITHDKPAAPDWQSMMAMSGVNGNARYVPYAGDHPLMTDEAARRVTFSFAAPVDNAAAWNLDFDDFAMGLLRAFPGASATRQGEPGPHPCDALRIEIPLGGGAWLEGLVTMPYPKVGSVLALTASAAEAAALARWIRDFYAPSPDLVYFTSDVALDQGATAYGQIPPSGDTRVIARVLQEHIDDMDE
ncbi:hypothetical protein DXZ75_05630 [Streptomyces sp. AcE210]|nr:hypothetical protein DXZ75_05630 [Streptomyces sp. AcE210]